MPLKKHTRIRIALTVAGAAGLAAVSIVPAQAEIPPAGAQFQIGTVFEGAELCVTAQKNNTGVHFYPLVPCDKTKPEQQWRLTNNGRGIQNVASSICIEADQLSARLCANRPVGKLHWTQDDQGRVWKQGNNSITRTYWNTHRHFDGPRVSFAGTTNGTTPASAVFTFDEI